MLAAVRGDAEGKISGLVAHHPLVADLHPQRIEEHHRIERLQRAGLPFGHFSRHRVRHRADQLR
jgi:hypothetical protein